MSNQPALSRPVALIGGTGALPAALVANLNTQGRHVRLCELQGFDFEGLADHPRQEFRLEALAELLDALRAEGIAEVCFAGAIRRPAIDTGRVSLASAPLVARLAQAMTLGDDSALRVVIDIFENAGFGVVGASDIAPDLLPQTGVLTDARPYDGIDEDLAVARSAHKELASHDAGQAVIVRGGVCAAREDRNGTDAMITALVGTGAGGLLFKAPKAGQDRRVDLPVIGPQTVGAAAAAGLRAIIIDAGGVMVLECAKTVALADARGICIDVRTAPAAEDMTTVTAP